MKSRFTIPAFILALLASWLVAAVAIAQDDYQRISIDVYDCEYFSDDEIEDEDKNYVELEISNHLDRTARIDFEGRTHHETKVDDKRTALFRIEPGTYTIRVSAPSFKTEDISRFLKPAVCKLDIDVRKANID